jgi:hypothetical protein
VIGLESRGAAQWKQHNDKPTVLLPVTPELLIILDSLNIFLIKNGLDTSY